MNPNKHLGDLLIGLGVIQKACDQILKKGYHVSVLLDEGYKELCSLNVTRSPEFWMDCKVPLVGWYAKPLDEC